MGIGLINEVKAWFVNSREEQLLRVLTSANLADKFFINDVDESGITTYYGYATPNGEWKVMKTVGATDLEVRYATIENNSSILTYSDAWTDRTTLTYEQIENV